MTHKGWFCSMFDAFLTRYRPSSLLTSLRGFDVRLSQNKLLRKNYNPKIGNLILFLTPGYNNSNGGVLSITSIYEETKRLKPLHNAETIMVTVPGDPLILRYTRFKNRNYIFRFSQVLSYFGNLQNLIIHIPELAVELFLINLSFQDRVKMVKIKNVQFNIMLQNIELLPPLKYVEKLKKIGNVTCTTAHEKYSTSEMRRKLGIPLHKLSTFVSPEQYLKKRYSEKENLLIVSPDIHPKRGEVLRLLTGQFPQLKIQVINNLTYDEYKKVISRAKWALTFGEGLDGYFIETVFSGGISFSAYNSKFFTEDFKSLRTVYDNYDVLIKKICSDIKNLDNEKAYNDYQKEQYDKCHEHYKYEEYIKNLKLFYEGKYTYR
ncbi:hypothetical protein MUP77_19815 [Candidatus Bathyarchaeota archaeon]|nr:hypothetical protein [Candidatus Bathyarchaeota archaeon]